MTMYGLSFITDENLFNHEQQGAQKSSKTSDIKRDITSKKTVRYFCRYIMLFPCALVIFNGYY